MANSVDLDEEAHYKPAHLALHLLRIQLFSFLALLMLKIEQAMLFVKIAMREADRVNQYQTAPTRSRCKPISV